MAARAAGALLLKPPVHPAGSSGLVSDGGSFSSTTVSTPVGSGDPTPTEGNVTELSMAALDRGDSGAAGGAREGTQADAEAPGAPPAGRPGGGGAEVETLRARVLQLEAALLGAGLAPPPPGQPGTAQMDLEPGNGAG